jgi:tripartite-type tricarboxylate transporter receptor subunit TctC
MRSIAARLYAAAFALSLALLLANALAAGAAFPERPIKFILGFSAGGSTDIVARTLGKKLSHDLGQNVIVENVSGASGNIATKAVAAADADGYTYLVGANPLAINEALFPDFPVRFGKDLVAVAAIGTTDNVLVVPPALNVHTLAQFAQRAREKPDAVSYATSGTGSSSQLAGLAFDQRAGTRMLAVAYRGGSDALKDLLGDAVDSWFATIPAVLGAVRDGSLVALATTGPQRSPWLPNVPTLAESGFPGYDIRLWVGVFARRGVPAEPMRVMEQAIASAMVADDTRAALDGQAITPSSMSRDEFAAFVDQEIARVKTLVGTAKTDAH